METPWSYVLPITRLDIICLRLQGGLSRVPDRVGSTGDTESVCQVGLVACGYISLTS
jgi:hypothetical protein